MGTNGAEVIDYLMTSTNNMEIAKGVNSEGTGSGIGDQYVLWDPSIDKSGNDEKGKRERPSFVGLGHELAHKEDRWKGTMNEETWQTSTIDEDGHTKAIKNAEIYATHRENQIRKEQGVPLRSYYSTNSDGTPDPSSRLIRRGASLYFDTHGNTNYHQIRSSRIPYKY